MSFKKGNKKKKVEFKNIKFFISKKIDFSELKINTTNIVEDTKNKIENYVVNFKNKIENNKKKREIQKKRENIRTQDVNSEISTGICFLISSDSGLTNVSEENDLVHNMFSSRFVVPVF